MASPIEKMIADLRDTWFASTPYQWRLGRLGGSKAAQLIFTPQEVWPGRSDMGAAIVSGALAFDGPPAPGVGPPPPNPHGFSWLRDLRAVGSEAARRRGRELIRDWIAAYGRFDREAWRPSVLAERLINWIVQFEFFGRNADTEFKETFLRALSRQARHLERVARLAPRGAARVRAAKGLVYSGICVPGGAHRYQRGLALLEVEAAACIHPDGGVLERTPSRQLEILRDLVDVQGLLSMSHHEPSSVLQTAIDRAAPMVRFFRHGDGRLALLGGGCEEEDWQIDVVLNRSASVGKAPMAAPHTGFHRLVAGRTTVIADNGAPPPPGFDAGAHAGFGAFELSVGRARLIVNCGGDTRDPALSQAVRATAAHTTLVLDDINNAEVLPDGIGRRPSRAHGTRKEADGNQWVDAEQDGYARRFGALHRRRLYLAKSGDDLRGEDVITPIDPNRPKRLSSLVKVRARFHLHPLVTPQSLSMWEKGGQMLTVRHPDAGQWALHAGAETNIEVEDSVYLGVRGEVARTRQIVLSGDFDGETELTLRWAFRRVG
jgi:uncharacterized heparinase superfamily protein